MERHVDWHGEMWIYECTDSWSDELLWELPSCITGLMVRMLGLWIFGLQTDQHYNMLHPFAKSQLPHWSSESRKIGEQVPRSCHCWNTVHSMDICVIDGLLPFQEDLIDHRQVQLLFCVCVLHCPVQYSGSSSSLSSLCFSLLVVAVVLNLIYYLISGKYGYMWVLLIMPSSGEKDSVYCHCTTEGTLTIR